MFLLPTSLIFASFLAVTDQAVGECQCASKINTQCSNRNGTYYNGHCYYLPSKLAISFAAATQRCVFDWELFNTPGYIGRLAIFFVRDLYDLAVTNNTAIQNVQFKLGVRTAPGKDGSIRFDNFVWGGHTLAKTESYLSWAVNNINVGLNVSGMNGILVNHSTNWTIMSDSSMPNTPFMCELFCEGNVVPCGSCDPSLKQINMSYCIVDPNPLFQLCSNSSLFTKVKYDILFDESSPSLPGPNESQCCPLCLSRPGCTSYAYSYGNCYFKNESGPIVKNGVANYGVCKELQITCYKAVHADIIGNDLISKSSMLESDCYGFCNNTPGCKAYSYTNLTNNGTCYLKTSAVTATRPSYYTTSIGVLTNRNYFQPENCTSVGGIFVGGRCFISPSFSASWDYALSWCRNFAIYMSTTGRLASFIDDTEMSQVAKSFINSSSDFAWIGLRTNCSCTNNMSDFYWMGAQNTAWKAVAPGGSYSSDVDQLSYPSCIMTGNVGNKRNDNSSNHHFFICEIDCSPMPISFPIITTSCSNTNVNSNSAGCLFTTTEHPSTSTSTTILTTSSSSSPATTTGSSSFHATSTIPLTSNSPSSQTSTVWSSFQATSPSEAISQVVSNIPTTQVITTAEGQQDIETTTKTEKFSNDAFLTTTRLEITSSLLSSSPQPQSVLQNPVELNSAIGDIGPFLSASLNETMRKLLGYSLTDIIVSCTYKEIPCDMDKDFTYIYNNKLGNCYTFNGGRNPNYHTFAAGRSYALRMLVKIDEDEYTCSTMSSGLKIAIHENAVEPFPDSSGLSIVRGTERSFAMFYKSITRSSQRSCFSKLKSRNATFDYSIESCYRTCYQKHLIETCNCADPRFSTPHGTRVCKVVEKPCLDYYINCQDDELNDVCDCPQPCEEEVYKTTLTTSTILLKNFQFSTSKTEKVAVVEVYYQNLNAAILTEVIAYNLNQWWSDIASVSGLILGIGVLSLVELAVVFSLCFADCLKHML